MKQETNKNKTCYELGNYVAVYYSNGNGKHTDSYIPEAELLQKIEIGQSLIVRPCISLARQIDLGIIREVRDYERRQHIEIKTDNGWYYIQVDKSLQVLLGDRIGWDELVEPE